MEEDASGLVAVDVTDVVGMEGAVFAELTLVSEVPPTPAPNDGTTDEDKIVSPDNRRYDDPVVVVVVVVVEATVGTVDDVLVVPPGLLLLRFV